MRLIDADELIVLELAGIKFVPQDFIDDAPTIDAVPVRHGRWLYINSYPYEKCSICGETHDTVRCLDNYCPNCGARMDG